MTHIDGQVIVGPHQKPRSGPVSFVVPPSKPRSGPVSFGRPGLGFLDYSRCHHDRLRDRGGGVGRWSGDEGQSEECSDDVVVVEASGSRTSAKPILRLLDRSEEDTV